MFKEKTEKTLPAVEIIACRIKIITNCIFAGSELTAITNHTVRQPGNSVHLPYHMRLKRILFQITYFLCFLFLIICYYFHSRFLFIFIFLLYTLNSHISLIFVFVYISLFLNYYFD